MIRGALLTLKVASEPRRFGLELSRSLVNRQNELTAQIAGNGKIGKGERGALTGELLLLA